MGDSLMPVAYQQRAHWFLGESLASNQNDTHWVTLQIGCGKFRKQKNYKKSIPSGIRPFALMQLPP